MVQLVELIPDPGDVIAFLDTGAYQDACANNWNALPRPGTVLVSGSQAEWIKLLRKHHMVHHSPKLEHEKKFGVSTTLWDHAFGTYAEE